MSQRSAEEFENLERELAAARADSAGVLAHLAAVDGVLRVIASCMGSPQPVFEKILDSCASLFGANQMALMLVQGEQLECAAWRGPWMDIAAGTFPRPLAGTATEQIIREGRPILVGDASVEPLTPSLRNIYEQIGNFSVLGAPLLRGNVGIGSLALWRVPPRPFTEKEAVLLSTFADHAVVAIENARMFREAQEALARQTASAEILKVISESRDDVRPVFEAIAERAATLCNAPFANVACLEGDLVFLVANYSAVGDHRLQEAAAGFRSYFPMEPNCEFPITRPIVEARPVVIPDLLADPHFMTVPGASEKLIEWGIHSSLAVPMIRDGKPIGSIIVSRSEPGAFDDNSIGLLQTFADQAVIAIENVRLFNETKEALEHQTATSEVLRVISGSMADTQPVFVKILESCQALFGVENLAINIVRDGQLHIEAWHGPVLDAARSAFPLPIEQTLSGLAILERRTIHAPDVAALQEQLVPAMRAVFESLGNYTTLVAPLIREGRGVGSIALFRVPPKAFTEKEIALLTTFADQAVIAIENSRLFNETQEALERQTATAEILRVISESPTDVQPVFDAIAERAAALCGAPIGAVTRYDGEMVHFVAMNGDSGDAILRWNA